jgi:SAM-dependent methyltransferase
MNTDFYQTYFAVEKNHWLMRVRRKIVTDQLEHYAHALVTPLGGTPKKILDFGSGSGFLVNELQQIGVNAYGVDNAAPAIEYGTSLGIKSLSVLASGASLPFADGYFDCVLAMDVLEHLPEEQAVLKELKRVLKKDGVLIITVPAYMFLWGRQDEVSQHFRRYTMGRVIEVLRLSGDFDIMKRSYFNTFLFPLVALVRVGAWVLNRRGKGSDFELNNKILNTIFFVIFDLERRILRYLNYPFGVSILVVLKKNT